ncbi:RICIN domain-containing protein [Treponema zioleckii]|uniref:RICIN domain-containing protein n=1 Tax=Treponema zioleckii TaxID=331680 RepID=UPI0018D6A07F|nr:RICIN domain-containing protein [Treponema zioleckii]
MKKTKWALLTGAAFAFIFFGCSNLIDEGSVLNAVSESRSVVQVDSIAVDSSIATPFGLVADVKENNLIRFSWGSPIVKPDAWYIYLDGTKVFETSVLRQVEVKAYAGKHVIAVAAIKNGRRSPAEGFEVSVKGTEAPVADSTGLVSGATYKIVSKCSGKSLDNDGWKTENGSNIHQWAYGNNQANQQWILTQNPDGSWVIENVYSGLALDAENWGTKDGTNVFQWTVCGNKNQHWNISKVGSYYKIINAYSKLALDVAAASKENGANIQTWAWNGTDAQLWQIEKVSDSVPSGWHLVWSDEFSGNSIDSSKWAIQTGTGSQYGIDDWGNHELQYYRNENAYITDGKLVLEAKKENYGGKRYTSARLRTVKDDGTWLFAKTFGRIEARIQLPEGSGIWPAFWMLPATDEYGGWASSGEIDIMEARGRLPGEVCGTIHFGKAWPGNQYSGKTYTFPQEQSISGFHTYAVEWDYGRLKWLVDGNVYFETSSWWSDGHAYPAPFDRPFYILLNLALGGDFDNGHTPVDKDLPAKMLVDYVRVYERN